jgi:hypothetical protein
MLVAAAGGVEPDEVIVMRDKAAQLRAALDASKE